MFKYRFLCKRCNFSFEGETKEQYRTAKDFHKKQGCILIDAGLKSPVSTRPELVDLLKEKEKEKEREADGQQESK